MPSLPKVSALTVTAHGVGGAPVNDACHCNTDGVEPHDRAIIAHARVVVICWAVTTNDGSDPLPFAGSLCRDLVTGPYFNQLSQYGVGRGSIAEQRTVNDPSPASLSEEDARKKVLQFVGADAIQPAVNENSLLYVLFLPTATTPTISTGQTDFGGYHSHTKFNPASANDDVFYAIIRTDTADKSTGSNLVHSVSQLVSHEIAEAVTNRDGRGWYKGNCEIGDLCEPNNKCPASSSSFSYRGWSVEQYWSNWDKSCSPGDKPVSLLHEFLATTKDDIHTGLSALGVPAINLDYVASRFR